MNSNGITLKLKNFIFLLNNGYVNDGYNGIIEYENCFLDHFSLIRGSYIFINSTTTGITLTHFINQLHTYFCNNNLIYFNNFNNIKKNYFLFSLIQTI